MSCSETGLCSVQVQLKEFVKLKDTIYEVDPKEEECFRFSRLLNFKVRTIFTSCVCLNNNNTDVVFRFTVLEAVVKHEGSVLLQVLEQVCQTPKLCSRL